MVLRGRTGIRTCRNVSIDNFDAINTPSLVGYWKCNEGSGRVIYDYSGNDFHLSLTKSEESSKGFSSIADMWDYRSGYLTLKNGDYAIVSGISSTLLDTGTNCFILSCELINPTAVDDCDFGTAWNVSLASAGGYRGLAISTLGGVQVGRASIYDVGMGATGHDDLVYIQSGTGSGPTNSSTVISTAFVSGDSVRTVVNTDSLASDATTYDTLELTSGSFALKAAHNLAGEDTVKGTSVRNFSAWSFSSAPDDLNTTLAWMSANPGKLPKWWEGR